MIGLIFWIIVGVLALSFFGISLESIVSSPAGQENFAYLWHLLVLAYKWVAEFVMTKLSTLNIPHQ